MTNRKQFAVCVRNDDYEVDLRLRKVYEILEDQRAAEDAFVRVIDESEEDYLYPKEWFVPIDVPESAHERLSALARIGTYDDVISTPAPFPRTPRNSAASPKANRRRTSRA